MRPARQTISPERTVIEADWTKGGAPTFFASSTTSPKRRCCVLALDVDLAADHQADELFGRGFGNLAHAGEACRP